MILDSDKSVTATFTSASGSTYYLAPTGNDSDDGGYTTPWKTFIRAVTGTPKLQAGDTLVLKDGTYNASNSGLLVIDCAAGANKGTASQPITIAAENERQALLNYPGATGPTVTIRNCPGGYWSLEGLHIESDSASATTNASDLIYVVGSSYLTLRRNILAHTAPNSNSHCIDLYNGSEGVTGHVTIEENECYAFHRHGILAQRASYNTIRRNYFNSRNMAGDGGGGYAGRGDSAISIYPGDHNTVENNISEGQAVFSDVACAYTTSGCYDNKYYGNISLNDYYGIVAKARPVSYGGVCAAENCMPHNTYVENMAIIGDTSLGIFFRAGKNQKAKNITVIGTSAATAGWDSDPGGTGANEGQGDGAAQGYAENFLSINHTSSSTGGYGFFNSSAAWSVTNSAAYGNYTNFYPAAPNASITCPAGGCVQNPSLGSCYLWLPGGSPLKGKGSGGADIGATVLYRYQDGVQTALPLWSAGGQFPRGATVAGLNDVAGSSLFDVGARLHVGAADPQDLCNFPSGYMAW